MSTSETASLTQVTRGSGLLETFLAKCRARMADRLLHEELRSGRILDIGCGSHPYFLTRTEFATKMGVDQTVGPDAPQSVEGIQLVGLDIHSNPRLPYGDGFFSATTMLAVFEHLDRPQRVQILSEVDRVLAPRGVFVMTTPAGWTDPLLKMLGVLGLVSHEEIDEHRGTYGKRAILEILRESSLGRHRVEHGYFECGMNQWTRVTKAS